MDTDSNRHTFYYDDKLLDFRLKLLRCRVPVNNDSTNELACLEVIPNITYVCERRVIPIKFVQDELYSYVRHIVGKEIGIPDELVEILEKQSTGRYILVTYPKGS